MSEWISVKDRLPDKHGLYVVRMVEWGRVKFGVTDIEYCNVNGVPHTLCWTMYNREYVTHWMPLPEPPKEV